ncbi:thymidine kinase [Bacillus cereus]|uniref:Thymidine kinase n=1 Tax=Bacillus thuringiensis TaxID=1428 RepID=A0AB36VFK5_BACTU|nr:MULTISPECIES: thymidine kinase [Bacillus cereus group]MDO6628762.1 thymidine kinase [Bacillus thuringiensis]MDO6659318.1 thymidine kinase [Bacillus thuringiensis]MDO6698900.1 thymidine kinase [Bacillus thuringiensis]MEB9469464.1 thymidine kinase [Bacillus cereus]MEC0031050.1 thymidine kinase [Bacillus cereus]
MGKVYFYFSTMNGQKSAHAIMKIFSFRQQNKECLVFKPKSDTRDGAYIKSRALNTKIPATMVGEDEKNKMYDLVRGLKCSYVFIDEVQFFSEEKIEELVRIADELDINIFCYGLLTDFKGVLFEGSKRLIECADSIREIVNSCPLCEKKATRNMRLLGGVPTFEGEVIQIGYEESYKAVCRKCFNQFKKIHGGAA